MNRSAYIDLPPRAAFARAEQLRIVDVRGIDEFERGHLPGSVAAPLDGLAQAAAEWERSAPILLVCRSGRRSTVASERLAAMAFTQVYNLAGGVDAWVSASLPIRLAATSSDPC